jgi:hypothetical protein
MLVDLQPKSTAPTAGRLHYKKVAEAAGDLAYLCAATARHLRNCAAEGAAGASGWSAAAALTLASVLDEIAGYEAGASAAGPDDTPATVRAWTSATSDAPRLAVLPRRVPPLVHLVSRDANAATGMTLLEVADLLGAAAAALSQHSLRLLSG